jgi:hypothetical protein
MLPAHEGQHAIWWFIHDPWAMFMKGSEFNIPHSWINSTLVGLEHVNPFMSWAWKVQYLRWQRWNCTAHWAHRQYHQWNCILFL